MIGDSELQDGRLLGCNSAMNQLAFLHVPPLVIRSVARLRILGAAAPRFAADLGAYQQGPGAQIVNLAQRLSDALDTVQGVLDDGFWSLGHGALLWSIWR